MERVFKHRETEEIAYYKEGVFKRGRICLDIGHEPDNEFWEEVENI
jgi:hypothetical protein